MRILRAKGTSIVDYLEPHLLEDEEFVGVKFADILRDLLVKQPNAICIYAVIEDEEILGFIIGYAPPLMNHVWLYQTWASHKLNGTGLTEEVFGRFLHWVEHIGRKAIRAETKRSPEAIFKRWKFETHSSILEYKLPVEEVFVAPPPPEEKEVTDGGRKQAEHDVDAGPRTEGDQRRAVQVPPTTDRTVGPTVSGESGGSTGSGLRTGAGSDGKVQPGNADTAATHGDQAGVIGPAKLQS